MAGIFNRYTDEEIESMHREFNKLNCPDSEFPAYVEYLEDLDRFNESEHMNACGAWSPE